ncbi:putative membrane protein YkvA [Ditylenchus destructor]|nr:putative membrane protein YkvA [Ditylenchus destructor]
MAARLLGRGRLPTLLFAVAAKGSSQGNRLGKLKDDFKLLQALCRAYWRGEYRAITPKALISVVAGLMYFLSPIDAIPDFIPMFGMLDDIAVLAWVMKTLEGELSAFRAWRDASARKSSPWLSDCLRRPRCWPKGKNPQKNG